MKTYVITILFMTMVLSPLSATGESEKKIEFPNYVKEIVREVVDLTDVYVLLDSDKFNHLFNQINLYVEESLAVLSNSEFSAEEKHVVLFAVQGLDLERFLFFADRMLNLLEAGQIAFELFRKTVFPPYTWSTQFPDNFEQESVRQLLLRIRDFHSVEPSLKRYINRILSGKALKDIREMRANGMLPRQSISNAKKAK